MVLRLQRHSPFYSFWHGAWSGLSGYAGCSNHSPLHSSSPWPADQRLLLRHPLYSQVDSTPLHFLSAPPALSTTQPRTTKGTPHPHNLHVFNQLLITTFQSHSDISHSSCLNHGRRRRGGRSHWSNVCLFRQDQRTLYLPFQPRWTPTSAQTDLQEQRVNPQQQLPHRGQG